MRSLWLMPGQGGQKARMLAEVDPELKAQVETWTGVKLLDTEEGYQDSQQIQLSILLLQVEQIDQLQQLGWQPDLVAGHSLGVFGAAYAAKVIGKEDVFKLVALRAKLMQDSCPAGYGMGVIVGLSRPAVKKLVEQVHADDNPVYLSNQNAEMQNTISGKITAIQSVLELAKENGAAKAKLLKVPNPSHSPLMAAAAKKLQEFLQTLTLQAPECIYLTNFNGHATRKLQDVAYDLGNNLIHPVYWETMMQVALEYEPTVSCEFSPGTAFTRLLKAKMDQLQTVTLETMSIDDADFLFNKWEKK
ncbi:MULTISPECIES: ACP S-malonyltransferase [Lactobacillus]|uniref:[acyl-carrier-protein] S-malonyltransferase n=1 Tax=Lactobacillus xujianguonis TaxID=2495899 RepID=A0A437SV18_9LACO|nr:MULTISPECIES: acyltransferase domain-containing protein [Lactobacillus]RVU70776.1 acyltransferase domain-containing protein [Lactobacillus xujianguonis]RVU73961.1 acyltransferase domain-containing protein [Lactobacillus xujianguonis]